MTQEKQILVLADMDEKSLAEYAEACMKRVKEEYPNARVSWSDTNNLLISGIVYNPEATMDNLIKLFEEVIQSGSWKHDCRRT